MSVLGVCWFSPASPSRQGEYRIRALVAKNAGYGVFDGEQSAPSQNVSRKASRRVNDGRSASCGVLCANNVAGAAQTGSQELWQGLLSTMPSPAPLLD